MATKIPELESQLSTLQAAARPWVELAKVYAKAYRIDEYPDEVVLSDSYSDGSAQVLYKDVSALIAATESQNEKH